MPLVWKLLELVMYALLGGLIGWAIHWRPRRPARREAIRVKLIDYRTGQTLLDLTSDKALLFLKRYTPPRFGTRLAVDGELLIEAELIPDSTEIGSELGSEN